LQTAKEEDMKFARIKAGLLALGAICWLVDPASAAVDPKKPKLLLHVKTVTTKAPCAITALADNCSNAVTKGDLYPALYHVQLIVDRGDSITTDDGVAGVQFGLDYPMGASGIIIYSWNLCATLEFAMPNYPNTGTGNLITWNTVTSCQRTRLACAGYYYMGAYAPSTWHLVKRQVDQLAKVADCQAFEVLVPDGALGFAAFSAGATTEGCNPCLTDCAPVAVAPTTWSGVKNLLN